MTHPRFILTMSALVVLAACSACSSTSSPALSPTAQTIAGIGCKVDVIAQPIALPFIAGIPTIGGIAATLDAALVHPLVTKACNDLAASVGSGSAVPVTLPSVPVQAAVPTS